MYFNDVDFGFTTKYLNKYPYDGKGLGKNEYGIIEPIPNKGKNKRTLGI